MYVYLIIFLLFLFLSFQVRLTFLFVTNIASLFSSPFHIETLAPFLFVVYYYYYYYYLDNVIISILFNLSIYPSITVHCNFLISIYAFHMFISIYLSIYLTLRYAHARASQFALHPGHKPEKKRKRKSTVTNFSSDRSALLKQNLSTHPCRPSLIHLSLKSNSS
ncbi:unnamed protein product [Acanthosepion pharaonis]|uniref:Uncharacterized protein n=1 Tax=Acanthosepion pharaonis TaxID=158019 RepID=A0A812ARS3_ACAPH|nr:unnamed protein product [Sepia pharaonis]